MLWCWLGEPWWGESGLGAPNGGGWRRPEGERARVAAVEQRELTDSEATAVTNDLTSTAANSQIDSDANPLPSRQRIHPPPKMQKPINPLPRKEQPDPPLLYPPSPPRHSRACFARPSVPLAQPRQPPPITDWLSLIDSASSPVASRRRGPRNEWSGAVGVAVAAGRAGGSA